MLKAANRLRRKKDFDRIYKRGLRWHFPTCAVYWLFREDGRPTRVGVVISNKISKKAVDKNRAKRLVREAFQKLIKDGQIPNEADIVVVGKRGILQNDFHKMYSLIETIAKTRLQRSAPKSKQRTLSTV